MTQNTQDWIFLTLVFVLLVLWLCWWVHTLSDDNTWWGF